MIQYLFKLLVVCMRIWYAPLRFLGRIAGLEQQVEQFIELSEENLAHSAETFGWEFEKKTL